MIEKIILDFLNDELDVPVYMEVPEERPDFFVVIQKTGSGKKDHICTATFAVQSYANSLFNAASLNHDVKAAMVDSITLNSICKCSLNSDYFFPNGKDYRYQAVFNIVHYDN